MIARRTESVWKAISLSIALFAITLNFLQPLALAASMRDGAPRSLWTAFCNPSAAEDDERTPASDKSRSHECCLGLSHSAPLAAPPSVFVVVEPVAGRTAPSLPVEPSASAALRDGPTRTRGPPSFV